MMPFGDPIPTPDGLERRIQATRIGEQAARDLPAGVSRRQLVGPFRNCYADIGTMWVSSVVTFPTVAVSPPRVEASWIN